MMLNYRKSSYQGHITPQADHPEMSYRDSCILSMAAATTHELSDYHRCTIDEAMTLANYLNKSMRLETAARIFISEFSTPIETACHPGRLWRLLANTVMTFFDDSCEMILELLVCIQNQPQLLYPWSELPYFIGQWQIYYSRSRSEYHSDWTAEEIVQYRKQFHRNAGTFEARMLVLGVSGIDELWAYRTINLICSREQDINFVIYEIHAWFQVAGAELAELLDPNEVKSFERGVVGRLDKHYEVQVTMFEHWQHWKKSFLQASYDEELTPDAKDLARQCHKIMKALNIRLPIVV